MPIEPSADVPKFVSGVPFGKTFDTDAVSVYSPQVVGLCKRSRNLGSGGHENLLNQPFRLERPKKLLVRRGD